MLHTSYDAGTKKVTVTGTINSETIVISLSAGNTLSVSVAGANDYNETIASILSIVVNAGSGDDTINLGATTKPITVPTTLSGDNGNDTITGGAGNDSITGANNNDSIDGGLGNDTINGNSGNDTVSYVSRATPVNVTLDGVANDGAAGELDSVGGAGFDIESIMGGSGNDTLTGSSLGNYISGGSGIDLIHGGIGSDTEVGGAGSDSLYGDDDADFIFAKDGEFDTIDGGPGIDSADVDSAPVEAPLPSAPLGAPLPAPPPNGYETKIDPATIPQLIQPLEAYCQGQVLTTRDGQGTVLIRGTDTNNQQTLGSDQFVIQTVAGTPGVRIVHNGGFTEFLLPSNPININGFGGVDGLTVMGDTVIYTPGSGTIISDGHVINFNNISPDQLSFSNVANLTIVTPNSADFIHVGPVGTTGLFELDGQSGGALLGTMILNGVQALTIDTGTHDTAANPNDTFVFDGALDTGPVFSILPGQFGSDTINVNGTGFELHDDPAPSPSQPTVTLNVNGGMSFAGPVTHLAQLNIHGQATIAGGGSKIVHSGGVNIDAGIFDIGDNTFALDAAGAVYLQTGGVTSLNGGSLNASSVSLQGGKLVGTGTIKGNLINSATVAPGFSPGNLAIMGDYTQTSNGLLVIEIGGTTPGVDFDRLQVSGTATLAGMLSATLLSGFNPDSSDRYGIIPYVTRLGDFGTKAGLFFAGGILVPQLTPTGYFLDVNLAPVAGADAMDVLEDQPTNITVLANDSDPDDTDPTPDTDPPTISTFTQPAHGNVIKNGAVFSYTPETNFTGPDSFTYKIKDSAGNVSGATVSLTVLPVNDAPSFTLPPTAPPIDEEAGAQTISNFATNIRPGPASAIDEGKQTLTFVVKTLDTALFFVQPAIDANGKLTYTPAADANGSASIDVFLKDNGGTQNGGVDSSPVQTFTLNIRPVNDAPQFVLPASAPTITENAGPQTVAGFATGILPGPPTATDEAKQDLHFEIKTTNDALFSVLPAINAATGDLTYTPAANAHGTADIQVKLVDSGGVANGGVNSQMGTFNFRISAEVPHVLSTDYIRQNPANPFPGNYLMVQFSKSVRQSLSLADVTLMNLTTSQELTPASLQYLPAVQSAVITLPGGVPPDGNYSLTLHSGGITDAGGTTLDGDGDGQEGGDFTFSFFQLLGDVDLDRNVGFPDLVAVAQNYGKTNQLYSAGDISGDGEVGFPDLVAVAQNYGKSLAPPGPPTPSLPVSSPAPAPVPALSSTSKKPKTTTTVFSVKPIAKAPAPPKPVRRH